MGNTADRPIRKFNPGTYQSDDEIIEQFVVRERELGLVMDVLCGNIDSPSCQHVLVVAPRGRGKSMLLARVAAELRINEELSSKFFPVRFMEESQEIFDIADFWLETLFHLARETARLDPDLARDLERTYTDFSQRWREQAVGDLARTAVLETANRLDRKLVLMVENMQAICDDVDEDFGWQLRKALQSENQIVFLGSAVSRFVGLDDVREPFFELFRTVCLEPLGTEECRRLWEVVTNDKVSSRQIKPLQILTGGNPRLLVIVADFARHRSLRQLMEELVSLIDDHTEYFRGHLDAFAKTERRVYLAVIDLWQPSSASEISTRARMDIRKVGALLGRLVDKGAVVAHGGTRKRTYVAAERLYSIYYKLRRERNEAAVVRNLVHFMIAFYNDRELKEMSDRLHAEAAQWPAIREGLALAAAESPEIRRVFGGKLISRLETTSNASQTDGVVSAEEKLVREMLARIDGSDYEGALQLADRILVSARETSGQISDLFIGKALSTVAYARLQLGEYDEAIAAYQNLIGSLYDSEHVEVNVLVAKALYNTAVLHLELDRPDLAITDYDRVIERFSGCQNKALPIVVNQALFNKSIALEQTGDLEAAISNYDRLIERVGSSNDLELLDLMARAMVNKSQLQEKFGEPEAAIVSCDSVIGRFGASDSLRLQSSVADSLINKGVVQAGLGKYDAAIASYDSVVERFGTSDSAESQVAVAKALFNKSIAVEQLRGPEDAIRAYDSLIDRFCASDNPEFQDPVAKAMVNKSALHHGLGEFSEAINTSESVVERFGASTDQRLQVQVAKALTNKGIAEGRLGEFEAAIGSYDRLIDAFEAADSPEIRLEMAKALLNKGTAHQRIGEFDAAITSYDRAIECFGASTDPEWQQFVTWALLSKGELRAEMGNADEALETHDALKQRIHAADDGMIPHVEWRASWLLMKTLLLQGKVSAMMDAFRSIYASFNPDMPGMMHDMQRQVMDLVARGVSERDLLAIFLSDLPKSETLRPLIVALRQRIGEVVRAPEEELEVAEDIRREIEKRAESVEAAKREDAPGSG